MVDPAASITPQESLVAVAAELLGERSSIGKNLFEGLDGAFRYKRLHAVELNVLGGMVDEKDGIAVTQLADDFAKNNFQVDLIKVVVGGSKGFATGPLA